MAKALSKELLEAAVQVERVIRRLAPDEHQCPTCGVKRLNADGVDALHLQKVPDRLRKVAGDLAARGE